MWKEIRKQSGLTQREIALKFGKRKQEVTRYENGKFKMPYEMQIYYLKLRNNEEDKIVIKYLERISEQIERNKN